MGFRLKLLAPLALGAVMLVGACGDDDGTAPVQLNATDLSSKMTQIATVANTSEFRALLDLSSLFTIGATPAAALVSGSGQFLSLAGDPLEEADLRAHGARLRAMLDAMPSFSTAAPAVVIPAEVHGTVYVYNTSTEQYEASSQQGAPSDGVRFILYAVDPITHVPAEPLNATGHVDLRDLSTTTTNTLAVTAVSGVTTFADYEISVTTTQASETFVIDGFVGRTTNRLDVTLQFASTATSISLESDVLLLGQSFRVVTEFNSTTNGSTTETLDITIQHSEQNIRLAGSATDGAGSLSVTVNGSAFATVTFSETAEPDIAGADGRTLTASEIQAIEDAFALGLGAPLFVLLVFFVTPILFLFPA